jgi:hypothetical protein
MVVKAPQGRSRLLDLRALRAMLAVLAIFVAASAGAATNPWGPFRQDEQRDLSLEPCKFSAMIEQEFPPRGTVDYRRRRVHLVLSLYTLGFEAKVLDGTKEIGSAVIVPHEVVGASDVRGDGSICDDLNGDGQQDFVIEIWDHGNSGGASDFTRLIALSSPSGYRYWLLDTSGPSRSDFVTYYEKARVVMLTTNDDLRRGPEERYSLYNLWTFKGQEIVSANALDPRFPCFILFTLGKPNHECDAGLRAEKRTWHGIEPVAVSPR